MSKKETTLPVGKSWTIHSTHSSYESANSKKEEISSSSTQTKIRRRSDGTFDIKLRKLKEEKAKALSVESTVGGSAKQKKPKPKTRSGRRAEKMKRQTSQKA